VVRPGALEEGVVHEEAATGHRNGKHGEKKSRSVERERESRCVNTGSVPKRLLIERRD
jgi:hypothetical protein